MGTLVTVLIVLIIAVLMFLAIRRVMKKGTCDGCGEQCSCSSADKKDGVATHCGRCADNEPKLYKSFKE